MYAKAVEYKGGWIAPGSHAMELYQDKKWKLLDEHLKKLDQEYAKLTGVKK